MECLLYHSPFAPRQGHLPDSQGRRGVRRNLNFPKNFALLKDRTPPVPRVDQSIENPKHLHPSGCFIGYPKTHEQGAQSWME